MCIWKVNKEDRHCEFCSYMKGCEKRIVGDVPEGPAGAYVFAMNEILGKNIMERCRKRDLVWGRSMVLYRLTNDGMSQRLAGEIFGIDHSTVHHCVEQVKAMLKNPSYYFVEYSVWNQFINKV